MIPGGMTMTIDVIDRWYHILNDSASILADALNVTYLEGIAQTADNIVDGAINPPHLKEQLSPLYQEIYQMNSTPEQVRKGFQLAVLKGMKDSAQPQHQMTPDAVALFMGYLANKLPLSENWTCLDPAVGTSNLLTAVLNNAVKKAGQAVGVDIDELLMKLSVANINLQQHNVELHHQDSLRPLLVDPVDVVISDLPYGYYFDEENAKTFQLSSEKRPMSHFLLIEQALTYTKPGGFLLLLIPNNLFTMDVEKNLSAHLNETAVIMGLLQLPLSMFQNVNQAKSILLLQKKSPDVKPPAHALLVDLPSFKNREAMASIMAQINHWFDENFSEK
jgi:site-specific DNA-methyltransferase (adenine-specific)